MCLLCVFSDLFVHVYVLAYILPTTNFVHFVLSCPVLSVYAWQSVCLSVCLSISFCLTVCLSVFRSFYAWLSVFLSMKMLFHGEPAWEKMILHQPLQKLTRHGRTVLKHNWSSCVNVWDLWRTFFSVPFVDKEQYKLCSYYLKGKQLY